MPRLEKFSKKSILAFSSWNWAEKGIGSEEVDAPERRGFWDGVDLCTIPIPISKAIPTCVFGKVDIYTFIRNNLL